MKQIAKGILRMFGRLFWMVLAILASVAIFAILTVIAAIVLVVLELVAIVAILFIGINELPESFRKPIRERIADMVKDMESDSL